MMSGVLKIEIQESLDSLKKLLSKQKTGKSKVFCPTKAVILNSHKKLLTVLRKSKHRGNRRVDVGELTPAPEVQM